MALLDDVKLAVRIVNTAYDSELNDLIAACQNDLQLSGVTAEKVTDTTDPMIKRAICVYAKCNFGFDNPDAERLQKSYDSLKMSLALSDDYNGGGISVVS